MQDYDFVCLFSSSFFPRGFVILKSFCGSFERGREKKTFFLGVCKKEEASRGESGASPGPSGHHGIGRKATFPST